MGSLWRTLSPELRPSLVHEAPRVLLGLNSFLLSPHCCFPLCLLQLVPFCQVGLIRQKLLGEQPYSHRVPSACDPRSVDSSRSISLYPDITSDPLCWGSVTLGEWFSSKGRQMGSRDIWEFGFSLALFDCLAPFYMALAKGKELLLWTVGFSNVHSFRCVQFPCSLNSSTVTQVTIQSGETYNSAVLPHTRGASRTTWCRHTESGTGPAAQTLLQWLHAKC